MLKIREQQVQILADAQLHGFYTDLAVFFRTQEPALFKTLSDEQAVDFARACHRRCEDYGLRMTASVYAWADFSILVGSHFFRDPCYRDLEQEIKNASPFTERDAMLRAQDWLTVYLAQVRGERNEHATAALQRVHEFHREHRGPEAFEVPAATEFDEYLTQLAGQLHPQLLDYHGPLLVRERVQNILSHCQRHYGLTGRWHLCFMTLMGMSFGAGFDSDELYPWIQKSLSQADEVGPEAAVEKLARRAYVWTERVLSPTEAA